MKNMKRIAVINDLSGLGKCSLTAAIPVISAMGAQACPMPTAVLSNQTGFDSYTCQDLTSGLDAYMNEWKKRNFHPDGIYCGFMASSAQADKILKFIQMFRQEGTKVLVDPIMGDNGRPFPFYDENLGRKLRLLLKEADVITPNLTEAVMLTESVSAPIKSYAVVFEEKKMGKDYLRTVESIGKTLIEKYNLETVIITGINFYNEEKGFMEMGNLVVGSEGVHWVFAPKHGGSYSGTGDLFAAVLSVGMAKGKPLARYVEKAVHFLEVSIRDAAAAGCDRNEGVCFERYLHTLWEE